MQILVQPRCRGSQRWKVEARVIEIFPILVPSGMNEAEVVAVEGEDDLIVVEQSVTRDQHLRIGIGLLEQVKLFEPAVEALALPIMLPKLMAVTFDDSAANGGGERPGNVRSEEHTSE